MARSQLTTQQIIRDGLPIDATAPTIDGDVIDAGQVALFIDNASGAVVTVTVTATAAQDGLNVEDLVVPVAAGAVALIGPFPARTFAQPAGTPDAGRVYVDYGGAITITRAVIGF